MVGGYEVRVNRQGTGGQHVKHAFVAGMPSVLHNSTKPNERDVRG